MDTLFALMVLASLVLLIIGFFNPQKSLFWYKQERTGTKSATIYGIALVASFILFGITNDKTKSQNNSSSTDNSQSTTTTEPKEEVRESKWTEVYTFKGNGMKKSPTFELTGGEARLKYNYRSDNGMGMGMFAANTGLAKVAVQCSADTFVVNQSLVLRINICGENRHLRQARNRYHQC
jgi:hypothetical protein